MNRTDEADQPNDGADGAAHTLRVEVLVRAEPATFETSGERAFKEAVLVAASECVPSSAAVPGVHLEFSVSSATRNGQRFDLDNLCEPVFVALCRAGWFGGKKGNVRWWMATRAVRKPGNVKVTGLKLPAECPDGPGVQRATYEGELPKGGKDAVFADWAVASLGRNAGTHLEGGIGIGLRFGSESVSIADIATGRVKNVIDCLWPVIGGTPGAPLDWRVEVLFVEKGCERLGAQSLEVSIWEIRGSV